MLDGLPAHQARASLADLVRINRRWGGHSTLRRLLATVAPGDARFSVLDIGAASGDMGVCIRECYPRASVLSLDYRISHLAGGPPPKVAADAFRLPFRPASFDFVFCSLFLHHFTNDEVTALLRSFGSVARKSVLVIDLERHPIPYYFIAWSRPLLRWDAVTVHDGAISVEAAFRPQELEELARRAGLQSPHARSFRPAFRIAMRADVNP